jgi:hypothetical protein
MRYLGFDEDDALGNRSNANKYIYNFTWEEYDRSDWLDAACRYDEIKGNWIHQDTNRDGSIDYFELFCENWDGLGRTCNIFGHEAQGTEYRESVQLEDLTFEFYEYGYLRDSHRLVSIEEDAKWEETLRAGAALYETCFNAYPVPVALWTCAVIVNALSWAIAYDYGLF